MSATFFLPVEVQGIMAASKGDIYLQDIKNTFYAVNQKLEEMIFLTVVACEIGRNSYFAGTDPEGWVRCLVGIMGNWLYK